MVRCPYCHSTTVGRVGTSQYYCWSCYYEFTVRKQGVQCYRIVEDGSLTEVKDINALGADGRYLVDGLFLGIFQILQHGIDIFQIVLIHLFILSGFPRGF